MRRILADRGQGRAPRRLLDAPKLDPKSQVFGASRVLGVLFGLGLLVAVPAAAQAQDVTYLTPFIGVSDGGDDSLFTLGGSGTFLTGPIGIEADFGWAHSGRDDDALFDVSSELLTLMGGAVYVFETPTIVEPYAGGGIGLIRLSEEDVDGDSRSANSFGFNIGGGANFFWSPTMGARADLRYFRAASGELSDIDLDFVRFTGGITFKF
ncbi:MAG: outer membrane beta-barrel protein [Luteitalea sp.]|nr:outer membrane beta-barrel protein [Luteitalea sp.]